MKIGTIKNGLEPLLNDAFEAEKFLGENKESQFFRRLYIRSVFAYIEGSVWILKQVCLNAKSANGEKRKISLSEYSILTEESYELKNNGNIKTVSKNLNLLDNIKFTFKTVNKLFNGKIELGVGTKSWDNLIDAKKVRNRITHPKSDKEMFVDDNEIENCEKVCSWFNLLVKDCFDEFIKSAEK